MGRISDGQLLEQSVFQNLRSKCSLSFYNKDGASEIDFIVDEHIALEVKTSASRKDITNLQKRVESLKLPEYYVVSCQFSKEKQVILAIDL